MDGGQLASNSMTNHLPKSSYISCHGGNGGSNMSNTIVNNMSNNGNNNVGTSSLNNVNNNNLGNAPAGCGGVNNNNGEPGSTSNTSPQHQQQAEGKTQPQYTIPAIAHFLQCEWQRFELERHQWTIVKAELDAQIAMLEGERKSQENLKYDLVRRIKMLEYALKQERIKYNKLKYGENAPVVDIVDTIDTPITKINDDTVGNQANNNESIKNNVVNGDDGSATSGDDKLNMDWKHGRQLLKQDLQEIGYTDTIIDARSNRIRSLLGLNNQIAGNEQGQLNSVVEPVTPDSAPPSAALSGSVAGEMPSQAMQAVALKYAASNMQFCKKKLLQSIMAGRTSDFFDENKSSKFERKSNFNATGDEEGDDDAELEISEVENSAFDLETKQVLKEFNFLVSQRLDGIRSDVGPPPVVPGGNAAAVVVPPGVKSGPGAIDIGDLAALMIPSDLCDNDQNELSVNRNLSSDSEVPSKSWTNRFVLKSHFDCVRCIRFHSTEAILVTCSDDETIKLWCLDKMSTGKYSNNKQPPVVSAQHDLEPIYTYRGHTSRVLSLTIINNTIFSGAQNGELMAWSIPANVASIDPYDPYDPSILLGTLEGHTDAIWSLISIASNSAATLLCSASADNTIRIWDIKTLQCYKVITCEDQMVPTCLASILPHNNTATTQSASLLVASFTNGQILIYDIESSDYNQSILQLKSSSTASINSIAIHPTTAVLVSAHEDKQILFWDLNTGECIHSIKAHLDEVTCVAWDPNGLYLLSGGHDCSVRLWNYTRKKCVQELTSHRRKFDEGIFDVTFHPTKPFFASSAADGLAKVFV